MRRVNDDHSSRNVFEILLVIAAVSLHLLLAWHLELAPDEAYYWEWSRHLAAGYFDHPPAIAWTIAAGTRLLGRSALGVRLIPILMGGLTCWLCFLAAQQLFGDRARSRHVLSILLLMPLVLVGGVLATPDGPLNLGWAMALWGLARLVNGVEKGSWLAVSAGVGLACLSKHTGFILLGSVAAVCVLEPRLRCQGRRPWLALLGTVALICPNLLWNLEHGGASFGFQLKHGLSRGNNGGLLGLAAFVAGQMGVASPGVVLACTRFWISGGRAAAAPGEAISTDSQDKQSGACQLLWWLSAPLVIVMLLASLRTRGEPNWPAPAYLAAIIAVPWSSLSRGMRWVTHGVAALISIAILLQTLLRAIELPARGDPSSQLYGWRELAMAVRVHCSAEDVIVTERYQEAAELAFWLDPPLVVTALPGRGRIDQYDFWPLIEVGRGRDVLWLNRAGRGSGPPFEGFESVDAPLRISVGRAGQSREYDLYKARKALADWPAHLEAAP